MSKDIYAISNKLKWEFFYKVMKVIGIVFLCFVGISIFSQLVMYPVRTKSVSMTPDVPASSVQFVSPFLKTPERGDIMLIQPHAQKKKALVVRFINQFCRFLTAQQWYPFEESPRGGSYPQMRRVIALPGDTIYLDHYVLYIQPKGAERYLTEFELTKKKYNVQITSTPTLWDSELGAKSSTEKITLGENEYFVLGDNRMECADSRLWGCITKDMILGKVILQYLPLNKIALF